MKPKSAKAERKKLPKARVMWALYNYGTLMQVSHTRKDLATLFCDGMPEMKAALKNGSCTISRCIVSPTLKSAKARLKIEQSGEIREVLMGAAQALEAIPVRRDSVYWKFRQVQVDKIRSFLGRSGT